MQKVSVELSAKQAEQLLAQLSPAIRIHLVRQWEQETWPVRFRHLLTRIDRQIRQRPAWAREAMKVVGPARRAFYARRRRR